MCHSDLDIMQCSICSDAVSTLDMGHRSLQAHGPVDDYLGAIYAPQIRLDLHKPPHPPFLLFALSLLHHGLTPSPFV
jgi:hypothetical protein